jgi:aspartyl protease family protein
MGRRRGGANRRHRPHHWLIEEPGETAVRTLILFGIIGALALLLLRQNVGGEALSDGDIASLIGKIGFLILISGAVLRLFRDSLSDALRHAMMWAVVALVLVAAYTFRFELHDGGERILAELIPGHAAARGETVEVARKRGGDFQVATEVNGVQVPMVLDTGATSVVLTHDAAVAAGLPVEMIRYTVNVDTANGRAQAAPVTLDRVAVGSIVERAVPALIAPPGQLKTSLLGMSFLSRLQGWEVRGDKVTMRGAQ